MLFPKASEALDLLAEAVPVERFTSLRRDLAALYAGYYIAELLNDLTDTHDPHPRLFDAARITLRHLGDAELRTRRIMRFELACLRELGLTPVLDRCAQCGESIEFSAGGVSFGLECGGVVCAGAGPVCRTSPNFRFETSRRFAFWPVRATPGVILGPVKGPWRRSVRRSGRSSVMSWGIVRGFGTYWECDPMVRVDRNYRRGQALVVASVRHAAVALLPCSPGCQTFTSPLSAWRAAYDGSLIKPISKDEMADVGGAVDSQNLFDRWVTPRRGHGKNSADGSSPSTLILGSDGWRPLAKKPKDPKADAELEAAKKLFEQGKFAEAEKVFARIAKDRKGTPWGETASIIWPSLNISAENMSMLMITSRNFTRPIPPPITSTSSSAASTPSPSSGTCKTIPTPPRINCFPGTGDSTAACRSSTSPATPSRPWSTSGTTIPPANWPTMRRSRSLTTTSGIKTTRPRPCTTTSSSPNIPRAPISKRYSTRRSTRGSKAISVPSTIRPAWRKPASWSKRPSQTFPEQQASYEGLYHTLDVINNAEAEKTFRTASYYKRVTRSLPPSFTSVRSPSAGPAAPGPSRPRSSWLNSPSCPELRPSPARS